RNVPFACVKNRYLGRTLNSVQKSPLRVSHAALAPGIGATTILYCVMHRPRAHLHNARALQRVLAGGAIARLPHTYWISRMMARFVPAKV
ncbi:MAG TPA: hypothetical protein VHV99_26380, partial [Paraburkholderia sp.]|nr:hypothetical protein [Paraburkholderia sp.]